MIAYLACSIFLLSQAKPAATAPSFAPIPWYTPEADRILGKLQIFPKDNAWNQAITEWPVHPSSRAIVQSIGANKPLRYNADMNFIFVATDQPRVPVKLTDYAAESDKGPYPVPNELPIEGWPGGQQRAFDQSFEEYQRNIRNDNSDRHAIVVDARAGMLYEFYQMKKTKTGWTASQASIFNLKSNKLRRDTWTSTDAAGLPIFPAIVRYDELARGEIHHALRVTVRKSRRGYVHPATHFASPHTDPDLPRMGERFRLRADFDTAGYSPEAQVILKALKTYGMLVADNGIEWAISVSPDSRIPDFHDDLAKVKGSDFEVVVAPGTGR